MNDVCSCSGGSFPEYVRALLFTGHPEKTPEFYSMQLQAALGEADPFLKTAWSIAHNMVPFIASPPDLLPASRMPYLSAQSGRLSTSTHGTGTTGSIECLGRRSSCLE